MESHLFAPSRRGTAATTLAVIAFAWASAPTGVPEPPPAAVGAVSDPDPVDDTALIRQIHSRQRVVAVPAPPPAPAPPRAASRRARPEAPRPAPRPREAATRSAPNVSGGGGPVVSFALAQVGKAYRYGATGPDSYDCSGLVVAAHARLGIALPHGTGALASRGVPVGRAALRPGDLVFTDPGHVGIYVGGDRMVHASTARGGVKFSPIHRFAFARRVTG